MDPENLKIPIVRQCELLSLPRSTYYYRPRESDAYNDLLMRLIDEQYTKTPFYGKMDCNPLLFNQIGAAGWIISETPVEMTVTAPDRAGASSDKTALAHPDNSNFSHKIKKPPCVLNILIL